MQQGITGENRARRNFKQHDSLALTSLILGLIGLVVWVIPLAGLIIPVLAVLLGVLGRSRDPEMSRGGISLGFTTLLLGLSYTVVIVYFLYAGMDDNLGNLL